MGVAQARDEACDLEARQLPTFARLRALRDLDLELVRALQVTRCDPESRRRYLLDAIVASHSFVVVVGVGILASFA